jgi:hypothetical protein
MTTLAEVNLLIASKNSCKEFAQGETLCNSQEAVSYFSRVLYLFSIEFHKLCPRSNSLDAFFEETGLQ